MKNTWTSYDKKIIILIILSSNAYLFYLCNKNKICKETEIKFSNKSNKNQIPRFNKFSSDIKDRIHFLKLLTNNNDIIYKGAENCLLNDPDIQLCFYHLLFPKKIIGKNKILIGDKSDGCYVILDDFTNIKIAYSFGIAEKIQFDSELAKKGIDVYMYDHTTVC